jgi:hypothetical protein
MNSALASIPIWRAWAFCIEREGKVQVTAATWEADNEFSEKLMKAEVAAADKNAEDAAEKATIQIIASFSLTNSAGAPMPGRSADYQTKLRARVQRFRSSRYKWVDVEKDIRKKVTELYEANEKGYERVGFRDGSLLAQVEV